MRFTLKALLALIASVATVTSALAAPLAGGPAPDPSVAELEQGFLTGMIAHHREAIEMAQMARDKATQPELAAFAEQVIADQQRENDVMAGYLRDWYGKEAPADEAMTPEMMHGMDMQMPEGMMPDMGAHMRALREKTGEEFDTAFMEAMIDHHAAAVMMAAPVIMRAQHPELTALAESMVVAQGGEIRQMDQWLQSWYNVTR